VLNGTTGLGATVEPADDYLPGEPLVLTVGYLIERKGIRDLIAALGRLRREGRVVHLAIAGDGPLRGALEEQAAQEGVAEAVHFLGRVPHARVLALMARAQLVALPSWDEAFGLVYTEAMAQGTPVIAGRSEGPEDFITDGESGYLVPVRSPEALAGIIAEVLDDHAEAAAIGAAGRAAALELSWERNARLTLGVYERILAAAPGKDACAI
jgi:glycosyltransferase involved in cell wall biosynthesis